MNQNEEVLICNVSELYSQTLDAFHVSKRLENVDLNSNSISEAIYFHLCRMKYAGWRHRIEFHRKKKHSLSDYFQDLVAFYLKVSLPEEFEVYLEEKSGKTQTDILIKQNGENCFIIEAKTTVGWSRPNMNDENPYKIFENRIDLLSENFKINKSNIIFVFEEHGNVGSNFSGYFWDKKSSSPRERPKEFPLCAIFPLFDSTDPYYWPREKGFNRKVQVADLSPDDIVERSRKSIVTRFEQILFMIMESATT